MLGRLVWRTRTRDHTASKDKHGTHSTITNRSRRLGARFQKESPEPTDYGLVRRVLGLKVMSANRAQAAVILLAASVALEI